MRLRLEVVLLLVGVVVDGMLVLALERGRVLRELLVPVEVRRIHVHVLLVLLVVGLRVVVLQLRSEALLVRVVGRRRIELLVRRIGTRWHATPLLKLPVKRLFSFASKFLGGLGRALVVWHGTERFFGIPILLGDLRRLLSSLLNGGSLSEGLVLKTLLSRWLAAYGLIGFGLG